MRLVTRTTKRRAAGPDAPRTGSRRSMRRALADERGGILALVAVAMVMMLASTGLAVDLGRGYVERLRLGRAVDAGALAAARTLRMGQAAARDEGLAVARANGVADALPDVSASIRFGINARGENTVTIEAARTIPTTFMRILGHQQMRLAVSATAAVPPIDLVLVLDQSGSLQFNGVWGDLQDAARRFVRHFDDTIDQLGLVSFQLMAADRYLIDHGFTAAITQAINAMPSVGDTNVGEGLRLAHLQMQRSNIRQSSGKVVVFFTDGRATALRTTVGPPNGGQDRMIAVYQTQEGFIRGYFDNPDRLPLDQLAPESGCFQWAQCFGWDEDLIRQQGAQAGLDRAAAIRADETVIYAIALGDPDETDPLLQPDLPYLRRIANENGIEDPSQPQGRMFFAPTAADLQTVFDLVAQDLMVRLAS